LKERRSKLAQRAEALAQRYATLGFSQNRKTKRLPAPAPGTVTSIVRSKAKSIQNSTKSFGVLVTELA
jgi:hypothetical protein